MSALKAKAKVLGIYC